MPIFKRNKKTDEVAPQVEKAPKAVASATDVAAPKTKSTKTKTSGRSVSTLAMRTILAPLATEKTAHLADRGVYAFLVAKDANRIAVRQAFRELYNVTPIKVNIVNTRGTMKRVGRFTGRGSDVKKALVTLPKGSHINVFESV